MLFLVKNHKIKLTLFSLFLISLFPIQGATITATNSGDWGNSSTWGGSLPSDNDSLVIPNGIIVDVEGDYSYTFINVNVLSGGELFIVKNVDLTVGLNSKIYIQEGGLVASGTTGSTRIYFNSLIWKGNEISNLTGPAIISEGGISIILPINLLIFEAIYHDEIVKFNWTTAQEINNDYFTIERSQDLHTWEIVDTIDGTGNSSNTIEYSATDTNFYNGVSYYRLKQTDFDKTSSFSHIEVVNINYTQELKIYPNPCVNDFTIEGENLNQDQITIQDNNGEMINIPHHISLQNHRNNIIYNLSDVKRGVYIITIITEDKKTIQKLIVNDN